MRVGNVLMGLLALTPFGASAIDEDAASFAELLLDSILTERAAASCGVSGYRRSTRPYLSRIFSYDLSTAKLCGDRCWTESQCQSYSFGYGTCSLFKVEVSRNFKSDRKSPFKFYDKSCAKPAQPRCGLKGYDNKNENTKFFTKTNCNLAACSTLCKSKDRCKTIAFALPSKTKKKRQTNGGTSMNYISRGFIPQGDGIVRTGVNLLGDNQADYLDLRAVALIKNSESGSEKLLLGAAQPGAPPGDGKVNSINRKGGVTRFVAQSAVWTVNIKTFEMSAVWFNANGGKEDLSLMVSSGGLFMTTNPAAFPDAVTVKPVADIPDKVSVCGNVNDYEYFNGACVEKCSSATVRQPNGSCKTLECPVGQMKENGVCVTCEFIGLMYVPQSPYICDKACMTGTPTAPTGPAATCANVGLEYIPDAPEPCYEKCPSGQVRDPETYGYISETMDGTGKRFLTGDVNNALKINFTMPSGTTKGEQLNFVGSGQPPEASSIPTLALILDMADLQTGQAFGNYAHALYLGTSKETAKGALPKEGIDNSMVFGRSREGRGKSFVPATAIWTIDTTTGFAQAYWIDQTGAKTKMIPCTSGTDLYFMPVGHTSGTELQFRAEIPGTPTPPPVGGPADCRTGTIGCPARPDRVNQCRSKEGFCVARDEVGACGYNCFPGNANGPASPDCWQCGNGYFGKSHSGCSPFPCPNPASEWRDRDGCHPNPVCTPPAVHNGNGRCVIYDTPQTFVRSTTTSVDLGPTPVGPEPSPFE
ncbi:hypothetical protein CBER1_02550 [Cercospora berteroae]|uniref:Apple domain-containing protein n=1 Tax=Cercospora berteroae TaxID=357750 RepID=A0A2S6C470_9PEZI|nr:hypothetical protein CBER1_02550 [Cercospora berteroae]